MFSIKIITLCIVPILLWHCSTDPSDEIQQEIFLNIDTVATDYCILKLIVNSELSSMEYVIERNDTAIWQDWLNSPDTLFYTDTIKPENSYIYNAYSMYKGKISKSSNPVQITGQTLDYSLDFEIIDATVQECWVKINSNFNSPNSQCRIYRDTTIIFNANASALDSVFYDANLSAETEYTYSAKLFYKDSLVFEFIAPPVTTMPTTSSNFNYTTYILGNDSGLLNDVYIVSENDIWVVGEIRIQGEPEMYNAAHWDGQDWELIRIRRNYQGSIFTVELHSIQVFDNNEIWLSSGFPYFWNGNPDSLATMYRYPDIGFPNAQSTYALWGSSAENVYFVGLEGTIMHYDGANWTQIISDTKYKLHDVYGSQIPSNQNYEILISGYNPGDNTDNILYNLEGMQVMSLSLNGVQYQLYDNWFIPDRKYVLSGADIYTKNHLELDKQWLLHNDNWFNNAVDGQAVNDFVVTGAGGRFSHFNGRDRIDLFNNILSYDVAIKNDLIVFAGYKDGFAAVVFAQRN